MVRLLPATAPLTSMKTGYCKVKLPPYAYNGDRFCRIQSIVIGVHEKMTVQDVLEVACNKRQLNPNDHYIRFKMPGHLDNFRVPDKTIFLEKEEYDSIEICPKIIFQSELVREKESTFGFHVEAELAEDSERDDELCVFVSDVAKGGLAQRKARVSNGQHKVGSWQSLWPLFCSLPVQEDKDSNGMDDDSSAHSKSSTPMSGEQIHTLLKSAEQVTHFCRLSYEQKAGEAQRNHEPPTTKPLSDAQKLRKVIMELVNTERQYNKDLNCLIERYLEPLKEETFLSSEDIENLFGNIQEIVQFQKLFLQSLEEAIELEPDFLVISEPREFREDCVLRRVLFSLGGSFLFYANHFKLYSSFCASHSKAQKVLNPDWNSPLKEFLRARNPKQQHSSTLESYLIKPIQRILKYPLLLQQLKNLTDPDTDEHHHLSEALKGMEAVAEHINEMQKIYEEYGQVFDDLMKQHKEAHPHSKFVDLNVGDLQMYGTVEWLTIGDCLGKVKKGTELITTIFVFKTGVVLLCKEKIKTKKKNKPGAIKAPSAESLDLVRYQTLIPVKEVQVKCNNPTETDSMYWWELVHLRSETEGRPERLYQMASGSLEARNDFLKTIHQIIRDSVRKMTLPSSKQQTTRIKHVYVPFGGKRLEHLAPNQRSLSKKRGKPVQIDLQRHSMNLEEQKQRNKDSSPDSDFRTRSKTFSDLNDMDLNDSNGPYGQISASHSKIDEGSRSGSAKLLYSSNNPLNYSSGSISKPKPEVLGSPIWKPRHFIHGARGPRQIRSPLVEERLEQGVFTTSGYGEYSDVMYDEQGSSLILSPPNSYLEHEHTDC